VNKHFNTVTVSPALLDLDTSVLRRRAAELVFDEWPRERLEETIRGMLWLQYSSLGVGLAAPQIGLSLQLAVIGRWRDDPLVLINPQITWQSEEVLRDEEGCLSFPGYIAALDRAKAVTITYKDIHGRAREQTVEGFLARIVQHEIDHLEGRLYVDRLVDRSDLQKMDADTLADMAIMSLRASQSPTSAG